MHNKFMKNVKTIEAFSSYVKYLEHRTPTTRQPLTSNSEVRGLPIITAVFPSSFLFTIVKFSSWEPNIQVTTSVKPAIATCKDRNQAWASWKIGPEYEQLSSHNTTGILASTGQLKVVLMDKEKCIPTGERVTSALIKSLKWFTGCCLPWVWDFGNVLVILLYP